MFKRFKAIVAIFVVFFLTVAAQPVHAGTNITATTTAPYKALIRGVEIWEGNIPTSISFGGSSTYDKLEFPIRGLLPAEQLKQSLYGAEVEFELWAENGKKIASDTVYTFDWNPVGGVTWVSMYMSKSDVSGRGTLLVKTKRYVSSNGLISSYFYDNYQTPVELVSGNVPATMSSLSASYQGGYAGLDYSFSAPQSDFPVTSYEIGLSFIKDNTLSPSSTDNFGPVAVAKRTNTLSAALSTEEILKVMRESGNSNARYFLAQVRAVSKIGPALWSNGVYTEPALLKTQAQIEADKAAAAKAAQEAADKAAAKALADKLAEEQAAAAKAARDALLKTIKCVKGKTIKTVKALKPVCPAGYKLKK